MDLAGILEVVKSSAAAAEGVFSALRAISETVRKGAATHAGETAVIETKVNEALDQMLRVKEAQLTLAQEFHVLEAERAALRDLRAELDEFQAKKDHYVLTEISDHSHVYALKPGEQAQGPRHYLCVPCFHRQKLSLMQFHQRDFHFDTLRCHECGATARAPNDVEATVYTVPRSCGWDDLL